MAGFQSKVISKVGTDDTEILKVVSTDATIIGMTLANRTTKEVKGSVKLVKADASEAYVIYLGRIPVGSSLVPVGGDQKVILTTGDKLMVSSSEQGSVDVIVSYLES